MLANLRFGQEPGIFHVVEFVNRTVDLVGELLAWEVGVAVGEVAVEIELVFSAEVGRGGHVFVLDEFMRLVHDEPLELVPDVLGLELVGPLLAQEVILFGRALEAGRFDVCLPVLQQEVVVFVLAAVLEHEVEELEVAVDYALLLGSDHRPLLIGIDQERLDHVEFD